MKKSVKSFLLALLALCLCASAGFAATTSFTLSVDIDTADKDNVEVEAADLNFALDSKDVSAASEDPWIAAAATSFDQVSKDVTLTIKKGTTAKVKFKGVGDAASSLDLAVASADSVSFDMESYATFAPESKDQVVRIIFKHSGDLYPATVKIKVASVDAGTSNPAFTKAAFTLTPTPSTATVDPTSFDVTSSDYSSGKTITLDTDVTALKIVATSSSDVNSISATGVSLDSSSSSDKTATVSIGSATSGTVTFNVASGESSIDIVLTLTVSGSSATYDFGTITFTPTNATSTTATEITSTDYSSVVSTDSSSLTNASKTVAYTTSGDLSLAVTFSNSSTKFVDVYYEGVSVSGDEYSSGTFTPATDGTYQMVFSGTQDSTTYYFAVGITITDGSSSGGDDTDPTIDPSEIGSTSSLTSALGSATSNAAVVGSTAILAALGTDDQAAYGVSSSTDFGDATNGYKYVLIPLNGTLADGARIYVFLLPGTSASAAEANVANALKGHFKLSLKNSATSVSSLLIKVADLLQLGSSQASDTDGALTVTKGQYLTLARIPSAALGTSSAGELTAADSEFTTFSTAATASDFDDYKTSDVSMIAASNITSSKGSSSSGCDAGFGALALLALVPFIRKIRK